MQEILDIGTQRYITINAPGGVGDRFTASEVGFKIFLWWQVSFTDGTEQTYLAIVHLKGDPCQERMDGSTQEAVLLVSTLTFDLNSANQFCPTTTQK